MEIGTGGTRHSPGMLCKERGRGPIAPLYWPGAAVFLSWEAATQ